MTLRKKAPWGTIGPMADVFFALLTFLALGVGTLLWAIHELRQDLREDRDDHPPKPREDA